jgi:hypothetical protein
MLLQQTDKGLTDGHLKRTLTVQTKGPPYYTERAEEIHDSDSHSQRNEVK